MSGWKCPECERLFAHRGQQHACVPSNVQEALERVRPTLRALLDELLSIVVPLPGTRVEHASGSFMVKAPATFCSFRPRAKDVQVSFLLDREMDVFPITKTMRLSVHRVAHSVHVDDPEAIDAQLRTWIKEAHDLSTTLHRRRPN